MLERSFAIVVARKISRALGILLLSGLVAATLIRLAPGFGIVEQELDPRFSRDSLQAFRHGQAKGQNPLLFYREFLSRLLHGDAGRSSLFDRPVADLLVERMGITGCSVVSALAASWVIALLVAGVITLGRARWPVFTSIALSGFLLSVPSAILAAICLVLYLPPAAAIGAVVFPRVFPHVYQQLQTGLARPHVTMARAKGVYGTRLLLFHVLPTALLPILALLGVSATLALGAAIPVEVLADSPGLGQLAWRAALARDMSVLVAVTLLLTAVTVTANLLFDIIIERLGRATA